MGGFKCILPYLKPGWIVSITSTYGQTWLVAVMAYDHEHIFKTRVIESIPWGEYIGHAGQKKYSIYNGDNPIQACIARENAK